MVADFETSLRDTNRRFAQQNVSVDSDWLAGCVEWFLSDSSQMSIEDLYRSAYEQWLLSDLAESAVECLPLSVRNNKNEFEFTGSYALQMQYLIDIGEVLQCLLCSKKAHAQVFCMVRSLHLLLLFFNISKFHFSRHSRISL